MLKPFTSATYRKNTYNGERGTECCLCGKDTSGTHGAIHVPVNHECAEFVTDKEAEQLGDKVSYYPIGPECAKRWSKEFAATSVRFRQGKDGLVCYDEKAKRT